MLVSYFFLIIIIFHRLGSKDSFFDTLPSDVQDGDIQYSKSCLCPKIGEYNKPKCESVSEAAFPTLFRKKMKPVYLTSPTNLCDRQKRDVHYLDNLTEEDIQLFKETPQLHIRSRREVQLGSVPKENATRYCAERISETKIGKLCAKIGVNVQALVNTCSADVEVSMLSLEVKFNTLPKGTCVPHIRTRTTHDYFSVYHD